MCGRRSINEQRRTISSVGPGPASNLWIIKEERDVSQGDDELFGEQVDNDNQTD